MTDTALIRAETNGALTQAQADSVREAVASSHSPATRRVYRTAWAQFEEWAQANGHSVLPASPESVAAFLAYRSEGRSMAAVRLSAAAIGFAHREASATDPTAHSGVRRVLKGIARQKAEEGRVVRQAKGLTATDLAAIKATAFLQRQGATGRRESEHSAHVRGTVDVALCALVRDCLLRRSEAAALEWSDLERLPDGSGRLTIRRSKTDQAGEGSIQYVSRDTVQALNELWSIAPERDSIFGLSAAAISNRIKAACKAAGLKGSYSGHSGRVGMAQDLSSFGASLTELQNAGRWVSPGMPARYTKAQEAGKGAVAKYYGNGKR